MTASEAFREAFYRCLDSDMARIKFVLSPQIGFSALMNHGEPIYLSADDPISQQRYLGLLGQMGLR